MTKSIFLPDYTPLMRMVMHQTRFVFESQQAMLKLAMMPWQNAAGFGVPSGARIYKPSKAPAVDRPKKTAPPVMPVPEPRPVPLTASAATVEPVLAPKPAPKAAKPIKPAPTPKAAKPIVAPKAKQPTAPKAAQTKAAAPLSKSPAPTPVAAAKPTDAKPMTVTNGSGKPPMVSAPKGKADDLTVLNGVGPKLAAALKDAGIYHFSQIAAWTPSQTSWVDENIAGVRGRASRNAWVAQASELAKS